MYDVHGTFRSLAAAECSEGSRRLLESSIDRSGGCLGVPVVSTDDNGVRADGSAIETEVVRGEITIRVNQIANMAGNITVEADVTARDVTDIIAEAGEDRLDLIDDNCLSLDITDLLGDDSLCEFLKDGEPLLDDLDGEGVAHQDIVRHDSLDV